MKRIAVYCGSATPADPRYILLARMAAHEAPVPITKMKASDL